MSQPGGVPRIAHRFSRISIGVQRKPVINQPGDAWEQEAERIAAQVVGDHAADSIGMTQAGSPDVQRDGDAGDAEKYKEGAKKVGEAFLETEVGKKIKEQATKLGEEFIGTLPGKIIAGSAAAGAIAAIVATNSELPVQAPDIPLDVVAPGLKLNITYEGPVQKPTKAMITFSYTWGGAPAKKPALTESEKFRAETARMRAEQEKFREGLKTPEERKAEQQFISDYLRFKLADPTNPLGIPGLQPKPSGLPKKKEESVPQRAATGSAPLTSVPPIVERALESGGQPLDPATRSFMESRFGHDFSRVRIHTDSQAARAARAIQARAYTRGEQIVFGSGQFAPATQSGRRLIAHELAHVIQQRGVDTVARASDAALTRHNVSVAGEASIQRVSLSHARTTTRLSRSIIQRQPATQAACSAREPERCPTYAQWLATFANLPTFTARDTAPGGQQTTGFAVLGAAAASQDAPTAAERAPAPISPQPADRFIDHPTDQWVRDNLPDELRETAYRLPADCADIAVVLRHVWLFAHRRSERYGDWIVGYIPGESRTQRVERRIQRLIRDQVFSGNVQRMVNAYSDARGQPLRSLAALSPLLHVGDILVWEHHRGGPAGPRSGGHTQTITSITRNSAGAITRIGVIQGNQPIFAAQAEEIREHIGRRAPSASSLRDAPGRRIEADALSGQSLRDLSVTFGSGARARQEQLWTWSDGHTTLVSAGPPTAAQRPPATRQRGQTRATRSIRDWLGALRSAGLDTLQGVAEAMLQEARATIEGGGTIADADAQELAEAAGQRLWSRARAAADLADESHFQPLTRLQATIRALRDDSRSAEVRRVFTLIDDTLTLAARGASTIDFTRRGRARGGLRKILLTGFDPFEPSGSLTPPQPGTWNPSGAAVLALDGQTHDLGGGAKVATESVVLPVSFTAFSAGLVERIVGPHLSQVDGVVTVSMDPSLPSSGGVAIERFAVGAHRLTSGRLESVPAAPGGATGPAIIETRAPVDEIAADRALRGQPPVVRSDITLRFASTAQATQAVRALNLPAPPIASTDVEITDLTALRQIIATMQQPVAGQAHRIRFRAGTSSFDATVVSGPGGNFLSNEVSYRVLRAIAQATGQPAPVSFHIHTAGASRIPQESGSARTAALRAARELRTRMIDTIRRIVIALARRIAP